LLVELAVLHLDKGERETIRLHTPPAGASSMLAHDIPVWINSKQHFYVILDGDQTIQYPDLNAMTQAEIQKCRHDFTIGWAPHPITSGPMRQRR
jgi:hypothetical protein